MKVNVFAYKHFIGIEILDFDVDKMTSDPNDPSFSRWVCSLEYVSVSESAKDLLMNLPTDEYHSDVDVIDDQFSFHAPDYRTWSIIDTKIATTSVASDFSFIEPERVVVPGGFVIAAEHFL